MWKGVGIGLVILVGGTVIASFYAGIAGCLSLAALALFLNSVERRRMPRLAFLIMFGRVDVAEPA